jgi:hypothetical protein
LGDISTAFVEDIVEVEVGEEHNGEPAVQEELTAKEPFGDGLDDAWVGEDGVEGEQDEDLGAWDDSDIDQDVDDDLGTWDDEEGDKPESPVPSTPEEHRKDEEGLAEARSGISLAGYACPSEVLRSYRPVPEPLLPIAAESFPWLEQHAGLNSYALDFYRHGSVQVNAHACLYHKPLALRNLLCILQCRVCLSLPRERKSDHLRL